MTPLAADRLTSAYTVMSAVEALASVTCEPGSKSTDPIILHSILSDVAALGRPIFQLFFHPAGVVAGSRLSRFIHRNRNVKGLTLGIGSCVKIL